MFIYIPSTVMVLSYGLLYYQLEKMMVGSKVSVGVTYRNRYRLNKCEGCLKIFMIILVVAFVLTEVAIMTSLYFLKS